MPTTTDPAPSIFDQAKAEVSEKVRKLLAKAEDPGCTTEEAQAFSAKAQSLISRFSIDLSVLGDGKRADELVTRKIWVNGPYDRAKTVLAFSIVRHNDCKAVWSSSYVRDAETGRVVYNKNGRPTKRVYLSVVGYSTDVDWVETLYASLEHQLTYALARDKKVRNSYDNLRSWTTSYIDGFSGAIDSRLRAARRQVVQEAQEKVNADRRELLAAALDNEVIPEETTSVALVLVAKSEKVQEEYKRQHPSVRTTYRKGGSSYSGRGAGAAAGRNASLARGGVGSGRALGR